LEKVKTRESKLKKKKSKNELLAKNTRIAKVARLKREGTYRRGVNLDDPEEDIVRQIVRKRRRQITLLENTASTVASKDM
jgi:hypothetical protein